MKIAVASDDQKNIADHFGKTNGFLIYESKDNKTITDREFRLNTFTGHARGLENVNHSQNQHAPILSALGDCNVVISHGMGRRIYNDLSQANKEVFITSEYDAERAVQLYLKGELVDHPELGCQHKHK
jgi:predicted Fe-Mo cluster-binding NifX family protein